MSTLADLIIEIGMSTKEVVKAADGIDGHLKKTWAQTSKAAKVGGAAIGVALGGAITMALGSAMETEVAVDKLVAQKGAVGKEATNLGQYAGDLWNQGFGESMDEVTAAVDAVTSSFDKLGGKEGVEKVTGAVMNLSKTFDIEAARIAQVAGQAVKQGFVKNATQGLDLFTAALQRVPAQVREDVIDAVDEYAPFLTSIGITGPRAFGLLVAASEKGMYGIDKTGDALKEFTIRATDMSTASAAGYDILGMSQEKMTKELLKGGDAGAEAFETIVDGLIGIKDPAKQSQAALALFGTPLEDLGVTEIPKFLTQLRNGRTALQDFEGATDQLGATLNDNVATKIETFKRQAQSAFMDTLAKAIPYIQATFGWLKENSDWLQPLAVGLGLIAGAIWLVVAAQTAWNAVMAVSPVTWIILAIVALIGVIVYLATKTQFFQTVWKAVWGFMKTVGAWFAGPFTNFFVNLGMMMVMWVLRIWNYIKIYFNFIIGAYKKVGEYAWKYIQWIINNWVTLINFIKGIPGKISHAASSMWNGFWTGFKAVLNKIIGAWNSLQFTIPGFSFAGVDVPAVGLGVPKIPMLADGGVVKHTPGGTLAIIGEGNRDEAVVPLDRGMPSMPGREPANVTVNVVPGGEREFRRWIQKSIRVTGPLGSAVGAN